MRTDDVGAVKRELMQLGDFIECGFVKRAAHQPAFFALHPKIDFAQIFNPDQTFIGIVKINFGRANVVFREKFCDLRRRAGFLPARDYILRE